MLKNRSLRQRPAHTQQGYMLVEALVSFVVIGVGILGAAKLNTVILQGAGTSKARAEAMLLAQSTMESARNFTLPDGCTLLTNTGPVARTGTNANYTVTTTYTPQYDTLVTTNLLQQNIQVSVSWEGGSDNQITLLSAVSCRGAGTSAMVGEAGASKRLGGFIETPTGRATVGGVGNYTPGSVPGTANTITTDGNTLVEDGTKTYTTADGTLQLIGSTDGKVRLSVKKLACEDTAPAFSTVSGKVFIKAKNGSPIVAASDLFVLSSDASYCSVLPYNLSTRKLPSSASGNSIEYFYTYYKCYIGAKWYGNIGITRTDNAPTNDRVCVGNPGKSVESTLGIFSRHPQRSTTRGYRGYTTQGSKYIATGIGTPSATPNAAGCTTYTAQHYTDHHFVVASNIGSDAACGTAETLIHTSAGNTMLNANTSTGYRGNPGRFYCMSNIDGVTCPDLTDPTTVPVTVVQGTITPHDGATLTGIDNSNYYCNEYSLTQDSGGNYHYNCTIHWTGYTSSAWSGTINFTQPTGNATRLCPNGAELSVVPSGTTLSYNLNGEDIVFTSVPNSVTQITLNLNAYQGACPTTTP